MKGFLQRIATDAVSPTPRVRPLVESIHGGHNRADSAAHLALFEQESSQVNASLGGLHSIPSESLRENDVAGDAKSLSQARNLPLREPVHSVADSFEPIVHPRQSNEFEADMNMARSIAVESESERIELSTVAPIQPNSMRLEPPGQVRSQGMDTLPNIIERLVRPTGPDVDQVRIGRDAKASQTLQTQPYPRSPDLRETAARTNGKRQPTSATPPARAATPQGEDIQIHIGRIEVLAVPQAAPRPAVAPVRKGLSLDEYLTRRNGRRG